MEFVWSLYQQPPALPLFCGSWRLFVVTCNVTTCSAANRSATTLLMTGPSQVSICVSLLFCSVCAHAAVLRCVLKVLPCFCVSVKEEALDAPSLARGSKRSLSGVSPPYAAPLSPKHLRTEAHPSEGTLTLQMFLYCITVITFTFLFMVEITAKSAHLTDEFPLFIFLCCRLV